MPDPKIGTLSDSVASTDWHKLPRGKTTLKTVGVYGTGVVTFVGGKKDRDDDSIIKEYSLGTLGVFDTDSPGARNITIGVDDFDVIKADVATPDGTTDLDIYLSPIVNPT